MHFQLILKKIVSSRGKIRKTGTKRAIFELIVQVERLSIRILIIITLLLMAPWANISRLDIDAHLSFAHRALSSFGGGQFKLRDLKPKKAEPC